MMDETRTQQTTTHRLGSGNYIVCNDDGRRIGYIKREQIRTAKIGRVHFVAYYGTQPHSLGRDKYLIAHDTLGEAVAHIASHASNQQIEEQ